MTQEDLHRIQEIGKEILFMVDDICRKYQIDYFLIYGTLLGCVRHKGIIPWDDDVDVAMTRDNFLRFVDICKHEINSADYSVMLMDNGHGKYLTELKIGKKGTTYCMAGAENLGIMNHVHLDVFVLESPKILTEKQMIRRMKIWSYIKIITLNKSEKDLLRILIGRSPKKGKWFYKRILDVFDIVCGIIGAINIEKIGFKMLVDTTMKSDSFLIIGAPYNVVFKKAWFGRIEKEYSGRLLSVPSQYDEVLKTVYGDYMQLPPEDKRYPKNFKDWIFKEN